MRIYDKIKEFVALNPAPNNIGKYLKDAVEVNNIYFEMAGTERIEDAEKLKQKENELYCRIEKIIDKWI